jgi:hypothetical protein
MCLIGDNFNGERCQVITHVADRGYLYWGEVSGYYPCGS